LKKLLREVLEDAEVPLFSEVVDDMEALSHAALSRIIKE
jgi:hypothetical protein